jgi:hypothetical protein
MQRERSEVVRFTRDDLEKIVRSLAQAAVAGPLFVGKFGEQQVHWREDGAIDVISTYRQASFEEMATPALPKPKRKK